MRYRVRRRDGLYNVYECRDTRQVCIACGVSAVRALALVRREE